MADNITTYKTIQNVRDTLKAVCADLQKSLSDLPTDGYRTKGGAGLAAQSTNVNNIFNRIESRLTDAHRAANALGSVRSFPKATSLTYKLNKSSAAEIKIMSDSVDLTVNSLAVSVRKLQDMATMIQKAYNEISGVNVTEQLISSLTIIDVLYPIAGLSKAMLITRVKSEGTSALKAAKGDVNKLVAYFTNIRNALASSTSEFLCCEENVKKKTYSDVIATTSNINEGSNSSNKEIKDNISKLEEKQKEYIYLYGAECQEIADEIARLKDLIKIECDVPLRGQKTNYTCGSASGSMILNSLGINISEDVFWKYANANGEGTYVYRVTQTLNHFIGSNVYKYVSTGSMGLEAYYQLLATSIEKGYPVEVVVRIPSGTGFGYKSDGHYVVVTGVYQNKKGEYIAKINDPFSGGWYSNGHQGQQIEIKLSDLKKFNANHSGYVICGK